MRVAVIGTGLMGAGMARSMRRAGLAVTAWNRTPSKAAALGEDGVEVTASIGAAVDGADAAVTMLFDADSVLGVTPELLDALGPNATWLQCSTVGLEGIARIAEKAGETHLLDAPVLGTREPAEQGRLVPLVSGDPRLVERVRPVLEAIGTKTVIAGERVGAGSALKLAVNSWLLSITAAAAQSIALARSLGLDPGLFLEAIDGGPANAPMVQLKGRAMVAGDLATSFALDGALKDLRLAGDAATGISSDLLDGVRALYERAAAAGHGSEDIAAVYLAL